ncbi:uncharacterized protein PpBr36_05839 [Pyricularia pennisetigena]|nr:uncharacterized protein PpBr36_05839 [Pyricularia pennisetigena]TLS23433.1 hypothetical protein PpBr36_05839 [Pyricularia pennisetigena]
MREWWVWLKAGTYLRDGGLETTVSLCDDLDRPSYCGRICYCCTTRARVY